MNTTAPVPPEVRAAWITAWATAIQTIAVVLTLIVAGSDYLSKSSEADRLNKDRTTNFYYDQSPLTFQARQLVSAIATCRLRYDPFKRLSDADWVDKAKAGRDDDVSRMEFLLSKSTCEEIETHTDYIYDQPIDGIELVKLLNRVFECVSQNNCDKNLAYKYFCDDVDIVNSAYSDQRYSLININRYSFECHRSNHDSMVAE